MEMLDTGQIPSRYTSSNKNRNKINVLFISEVLGWVNKGVLVFNPARRKVSYEVRFSRTNDKITYRS